MLDELVGLLVRRGERGAARLAERAGDAGGVVVEEGPPSQVFGAPREERTREFLARFTA